MVAPPHSDNHNDQAQVNDFIHQPIPYVSEFDFVGVLQVTMQLGRGYARGLQPFGQLLFKQRPD